MLARTLAVITVLGGCGGAGQPAPPPRTVNNPQTLDKPARQEEIVGDVERIPVEPRRRRMVIWGKVQRIIEAKHDQLPEPTPTSTGGVGDPVTEIRNATPFSLTLYFAGKCAYSTTVPPMDKVTAVFCPGKYNIAAVVDNQSYLPLVSQDQEFKGGVGYLLQVVIKQQPK